MTEEQAKTKLCWRTLRVGEDDNIVHASLCQGSECMAFRLDRAIKHDPALSHPIIEERAFCGLAGRP